MTADEELIEQLKVQLFRDEGIRLRPYKDSKGVWTVGVGHNLEAKALTRKAVEQILYDDMWDVVQGVEAKLPWTERLDGARRGALLNMAFNLGLDGLLKFEKTLAFVRKGDYQAAANEMLDSEWANQVGERARRLARQMKEGTWQ